MKIKRSVIFVVICVVGVGFALGAYGGFGPVSKTATTNAAGPHRTVQSQRTQSPNASATPAPVEAMPDNVRFNFLFHHLAKIAENERVLRLYQPKTGLRDEQFTELVRLAAEHEREGSVIDKQAKVIIDDFHARYPRKMPEGMAPPPPPQELLDLQTQRDAVSLRYRDSFKNYLGDEAYSAFQKFMDTEFPPQPKRDAPPQPDVTPTKNGGLN